MYPIIFSFKDFHVYSYGAMVALGMVIAMLLIEKDAEPAGLSKEKVIDLIFWSVVWGLIGARLFYVQLYPLTFAEDWTAVFRIYEGGLVFHGGLIFGTIAAFINFKLKRLPVFKSLDLLALYMPLAHAFGRIGCFLNGCCAGKACDAVLGVRFNEYSRAVYPTQLYSALLLLLIFVALKKIRAKQVYPGQISSAYLVLYGIMRFSIEFLRDNPLLAFGLSAYQMISLFLIAGGLFIHIKQHKQRI